MSLPAESTSVPTAPPEVREPHAAASPARTRSRLRVLLYLICTMTDFAAFMAIFTASRGLADQHAPPWYLGVIGAGLSFAAGIGSIFAGWLASRFDGRVVFVVGALGVVVSVFACSQIDPQSLWFLAGYWSLGITLACIYPPLIGWLNQGEDAHADHAGVSRRLILYCVAWNVGMMCGQLLGGTLFSWGARWIWGATLVVAGANLATALVAVRLVSSLPAIVPASDAAVHPAAAIATLFKRLSWIANLGGVFGGAMVIHLLPDVIVSLHISPDAHGQLLAAWRAVIIAAYVLMYFVGFWHYRLNVSLTSQVFGALGLMVIAQAESAAMLLVGLALLGQLVGFNYFSGLFYSTAGSAQDDRAMAAGIHEATLAAGMALGTIVGGVLGSLIDHRMPYRLAAAVIAALIAVQIVAWRKWSPHVRNPPH